MNNKVTDELAAKEHITTSAYYNWLQRFRAGQFQNFE